MAETPTPSRVPYIGEVTAYTETHQLACAPGTISAEGMVLFPPASARPGLALRLMLKMTDVGKQVVVDAVLARETFEDGRYAWEVEFVKMSPPVAEFFARYVADRLAAPSEAAVRLQVTQTGPLRPSSTGPLPRTPTGPLPRTPTGPLNRVPSGPGFHASTSPGAADSLTTQRGVGAVGDRPARKEVARRAEPLLPDIHLDDDDIEDVPEDGDPQDKLRPRDMDSDQLNRYMRSGKLSQLFKAAVADLDRPVEKKK
jgi:hypothetical protein